MEQRSNFNYMRWMWGIWLIGLVILLWQAYHPLWRPHLQVDVATFHQRTVSFLQNSSWRELAVNEYQPGALWFFAVLGWLTPPPVAWDGFFATIVLVNSLLIAAHFYYFLKHGSRYAPLIFLGVLLATGPILLYRFELLVSLLVLGAWHYFQKQRWVTAGFLLGIAVAIKLYPIVLLPLFLAEAWRRRQVSRAVSVLIYFTIGVLLPVLLFIAWGGSFEGLLAALKFHGLKPIGLEGVWGVVVTTIESIQGIPVRITPGYGVHGLTSDLPLLSNHLLEIAWMIPYGLTLLLIVWRWRKIGYTDGGLAFVLLLVFVYFAKVVNPQYLWWFAVMFPLLARRWYQHTWWHIAPPLLVVSLFLTQMVYPLRYTEFLEWFNGTETNPVTFIFVIVKNLLLLGLLMLTWYGVYRLATPNKHPYG